jgi:hypothetical protein
MEERVAEGVRQIVRFIAGAYVNADNRISHCEQRIGEVAPNKAGAAGNKAGVSGLRRHVVS